MLYLMRILCQQNSRTLLISAKERRRMDEKLPPKKNRLYWTVKKIFWLASGITALVTGIGWLIPPSPKPVDGYWVGSYKVEGVDIPSRLIFKTTENSLKGKMGEVRKDKNGSFYEIKCPVEGVVNGFKIKIIRNCTDQRINFKQTHYEGKMDKTSDFIIGVWSLGASAADSKYGTFEFKREKKQSDEK